MSDKQRAADLNIEVRTYLQNAMLAINEAYRDEDPEYVTELLNDAAVKIRLASQDIENAARKLTKGEN